MKVKYKIIEDKFKNEMGKPIIIYSIKKKQKGFIGLLKGWSVVKNPSYDKSIIIFYHKFDAKRYIVSVDKTK